MKFAKKFKLNLLTLAKKIDSDMSPYELILLAAGKKMGGIPEGKQINPSSIWVSSKDFYKIHAIALKWAKKQLPGYSIEYVRKSLSWLTLDISPACSDKLEDGYVYIRDDIFATRRSL